MPRMELFLVNIEKQSLKLEKPVFVALFTLQGQNNIGCIFCGRNSCTLLFTSTLYFIVLDFV